MASHWSENKERGSVFALKLFFFFYKYGGQVVAALLLYPVTAYFFLTARSARRHSLDYLTRLYTYDPERSGFKKPPGRGDVFKHFLAYSRGILDRTCAWAGVIKRSDIYWPNKELILELNRRKQGALIMGAHIGHLDLLRGVIQSYKEIKFNALVFYNHTPHITKFISSINEASNVNLVSVDSVTPDVAILLKEKVDAGEFVAILSERSPVGARSRTHPIPFLGKEARFPEGPVILASLLDCPVFFMFCLRKSAAEYEVYMEPFEQEQLTLKRKTRQQDIRRVQKRLAECMENACYKAPYQWFNYYDFWRDEQDEAG